MPAHTSPTGYRKNRHRPGTVPSRTRAVRFERALTHTSRTRWSGKRQWGYRQNRHRPGTVPSQTRVVHSGAENDCAPSTATCTDMGKCLTNPVHHAPVGLDICPCSWASSSLTLLEACLRPGLHHTASRGCSCSRGTPPKSHPKLKGIRHTACTSARYEPNWVAVPSHMRETLGSGWRPQLSACEMPGISTARGQLPLDIA